MIVVAGEALIDLILYPDLRLTAVAGGGPFNTARTIGRLGGEVAFVGRLSTDRFGVMLREGPRDRRRRPGRRPNDRVADDPCRRRTRCRRDCDLSLPHGRDIGAGPGPRRRHGGHGRCARSHPRRDARAGPRADGVRPGGRHRPPRRRHAPDGRPELPGRRDRRSRGLPRTADDGPRPCRHRQGQRRRPGLHGPDSAAGRSAPDRCSRSGRASCC